MYKRSAVICEGTQEKMDVEYFLKRQKWFKGSAPLVLFAPMQPKAAAGQIARSALDRVRIAKSEGCDPIIVIIDREELLDCPPILKRNIEVAFQKFEYSVNVVIKNRKFENWLIADIHAISACKEFSVSKSFRRKVEPDKADHVDNASDWLKMANCLRQYEKNKHPRAILEKADCKRIAGNSRSFRRFLRLLEHPDYLDQSRRPAR
jgi:hypothetical protein